EMYPNGEPQTRVAAGAVATLFEGATRPGHFDGMLTVVAKLFNIVRPTVAVFGRKDAQQVYLVKRMIADLNLPLRLDVVDTVREPDGLALSSRNRYLSEDDRRAALVLSAALEAAAASAGQGADFARVAGRNLVAEEPMAELDYFDLVDPATFLPVPADFRGEATAIIAARVGTTRLIDNRTVTVT
ncbi:MAG TPA: pantoate--beta-alanine ligase, partial [Homoserinimonas sp.]|nr:pantoate--beta-alanine ligase [Homoserinimonas sp.]